MPKRFCRAVAVALALSTVSTLPLSAEPDLGTYLAARQAMIMNDFGNASRYFTEALAKDPGNAALRENALAALISMGEFDAARPIADAMIADGQSSQLANLVLVADDAANEDWESLFNHLEAGYEVGPLIDGIGQAWAFVGSGRMGDALTQFEEISDTPGMRSFAQLHKAFALALVGDLEGADAVFSLSPDQGIIPTRGSVVTHIEVLCRLGEYDRAQETLQVAFGDAADPDLERLREQIAAREIPEFQQVASPREGMSYLFLSLAEALRGEADDSFLLLYAQAAAYIDPDRAGAQIAAARLLDALGQHDLAAETFAKVATDDRQFHVAELGRADTLRAAGRTDAAIEVLTQLARSRPDLAIVHASLGDIYRQTDEFAKANAAYTQALALYSEDDPVRWWVTYTRGITFERMGEWPAAEADFREALTLSPGQPAVLNYLGYSMVEMGINLDEALAMIEEAAAARPDNGAIIDSLGWVLYKLGRYGEAVTYMERAVELEPVDPIVTDHLGDVYWMVGREAEARFQWHRALSFNPEDEQAERIRSKLDAGLMAVLEAEGVDLSEMAYDQQ